MPHYGMINSDYRACPVCLDVPANRTNAHVLFITLQVNFIYRENWWDSKVFLFWFYRFDEKLLQNGAKIVKLLLFYLFPAYACFKSFINDSNNNIIKIESISSFHTGFCLVLVHFIFSAHLWLFFLFPSSEILMLVLVIKHIRRGSLAMFAIRPIFDLSEN